MSMSSIPLPVALMYAALGGTLLALLWATAVNRWSLKVFFILALRLAIGWHFLFEGLHKVHSHYMGAGETNRPFSSEMYFVVGEGPAAAAMRKKLGDPEEQLAAKTSDANVPEPLKKIAPNARLEHGPNGENAEEYTRELADPEKAAADLTAFAKMAPPAVTQDWENFVNSFAEKYKLTPAEKKKIDAKLDDDERAELVAARKAAEMRGRKLSDKDKEELKALLEKAGPMPGDLGVAALAAYGRWVAGVEGREAKVKYVSGQDPQWTAPQRLEYLHHRQAELDALQRRSDFGLGHGYGLDQKKLTELKQLVTTARKDIITDADALLTDLKKNAVAAVLAARFESKAPGPYKALAGDTGIITADRLAPVLPPEKVEAANYDAIPAAVRQVWDNYYKEFKASYPLDDKAAGAADEAYRLAQARLANWYFGRDEYSGQPTPGKGFPGMVKKYHDAEAREKKFAEKLKTLTPPAAPKEEAKADRQPGLVGALAAAAKPPAASGKATPGLAFTLTRAAAANGAAQATNDVKAAPDVLAGALEAKFTDFKGALAKALPTEVQAGPVTVKPDRSFIERLDTITMWTITGIGACLLIGFLTRIAALAGTVFLVMTYLTHPPFPWLPLPPGTEGNPVYVNKNVIEALGLLVVLVHPTGRWLGIDALLHRLFFRNSAEYLGPPRRARKAPPPPPPGKPVTGRA